VTGITKTTTRHESIRKTIGSLSNDRFHLRTYDDADEATEEASKKYTNVVFCAPPSGFDDYPGAVKDAMDNLWAGPDAGGTFVFTSSGGIYGPGKGESVSETTPISPPSTPRSLRLHEAERICSSSPGTAVLRLAGLYTLERGAHNYWLTSEGEGAKSVGPGDSIINLLHYDDAAGACVAALAMGSGGDGGVLGGGGRVFLVSDGNPITRRGICESALKSKLFSDSIMPVFESGVDGEKTGKVYDGSWTNEALKWKPVYPSFDEFMAGS